MYYPVSKYLTNGICFLFLLLSSGCQVKQYEVQIIKDLEYATYKHQGATKKLLLDLYLPQPQKKEAQPLLIYIHGGGWREFNKELCPGKMVAQRGWAIACINYRYSTEAIFPAQIHDSKAAIRWLRANATKYNFDPDNFGAWGASAGGHLSSLLGTSEGVASLEGNLGNLNYSSGVQAVCNWYGPTDFTKVKPTFTEAISPEVLTKYKQQPWYLYTVVTTLLLGGSVANNQELAQAANPITYIDSSDPPFMIVHGDLDEIVPVHQSVILVEALESHNVPVTFIRNPQMTHSHQGKNGEKFDLKLVDLALDFFEKTLMKESRK
jgi:acetyl esterase/lipase